MPPEYQQTAAVWVRGKLQDDYGVSAQDLRGASGRMEMPGRIEKVQFAVPSAGSLEAAPEGKTLSGMLGEGEIDALIAPLCTRPRDAEGRQDANTQDSSHRETRERTARVEIRGVPWGSRRR
jgi:4,5-dihydroxyphthalate decarboxylase